MNDMREGHGTLHEHDGSKYIGAWKHDSRNGKGFYTKPDGSKYDG